MTKPPTTAEPTLAEAMDDMLLNAFFDGKQECYSVNAEKFEVLSKRLAALEAASTSKQDAAPVEEFKKRLEARVEALKVADLNKADYFYREEIARNKALEEVLALINSTSTEESKE